VTGFLLAVYIFWTAKRPNSCRCICQDFNGWPCACRVCVLPISGLGDRSGYAGLHSLRLGYDSQWKKENAGRFCLSVLWVTSPDPLDPSKFGGPYDPLDPSPDPFYPLTHHLTHFTPWPITWPILPRDPLPVDPLSALCQVTVLNALQNDD